MLMLPLNNTDIEKLCSLCSTWVCTDADLSRHHTAGVQCVTRNTADSINCCCCLILGDSSEFVKYFLSQVK